MELQKVEDVQNLEMDLNPKPLNAPLSEHASVDHALNVFVIFQNLMSMLPLKELLNCGLLNQSWNLNTREYIRERKVCYAQIGIQIPCKQLQAFFIFLHKSANNIPFNGVSISPQCSSGTCPLSKNHQNSSKIFDHNALKMLVKHLQILPLNQNPVPHPGPIWQQNTAEDCPLKEFLHDFVLKTASNLESISVSYPRLDAGFVTDLLHSNSNPSCLGNLRVIEFRQKPKNMNPLLIDSIIKASPNLQSFLGFLRSSQLQSLISKGKVHIIKELVLVIGQYRSLFKQLGQASSLKLQILTIPEQWDWTCLNLSKYIYILNLIFQSSSKSLKEINVDFSLLRILNRNFELSFANVTLIRIKYSQSLDKKLGFRLLKSINFSKIFPNLISLELHLHESGEFTNGFLLDEFEGFVSEYVCPTVTNLSLRSSWDVSWNTETLQVMKDVFPNVKHFQVQHVRNLRTFLRRLWSAWEDLESIDLYVLDDSVRENLDGIFCGISEDDVEELLGISKHLEEVAWVEPEQLSIIDLASLKNLRLQIHHAFDCFRRDTCCNAFITRVTGYLAFSKMPQLQVEIIRNECEWTIWEGFHSFGCYFNFRQLEPFANIISIDPEYTWKQKFDFKYYTEPRMQF